MIYHVTDWDDAYANGAHIPQADGFVPRWQNAAAAFRQAHPPQPLGRGHLFRPAGTAQGLMVFVHGGYWMRFDPGLWSHLAAGALARGWAVALPGYTLAPQARIAQMTREVAAAVAEAAAESPALLAPRAGIPVTTWVGGMERPEFIRQSRLLANIWAGLGAATDCVIDPGLHHFDVIERLEQPDSPLLDRLLVSR